MISGQLALVVSAVFAGAALYINIVEQPARLQLATPDLLTEWKLAYKRGTLMQAPLAVLGLLLGGVAWWQTGRPEWMVGGALMIVNWPFTFLVIMPVNHKLMAADSATTDVDVRKMIEHWNRLHAGRTALGCAATAAFLWASLS